MDLHPDVEAALGIFPAARPDTRALGVASRTGYRAAEFVVALGPHMARTIQEDKGVRPDRIHGIPVWTDGREVRPVPREENPLRRELGFGAEDFVVMYSGNAGLAHRFDEVLEAADQLRELPDVHFLFVGGGPRRAEIEAEARRRSLPRFRYLDYVPRRVLARSLSVGDVHLLTLRPELAGLSAPGKLYGIMAVGRPVLMVGPPESDPGHVILEERVGEVVPPGPGGGERLAELFMAYRSDPKRRAEEGGRARAAFLAKFEKSVCCAAWTELLVRVLAGEAPPWTSGVERVGSTTYVEDCFADGGIATGER